MIKKIQRKICSRKLQRKDVIRKTTEGRRGQETFRGKMWSVNNREIFDQENYRGRYGQESYEGKM